jgi:hypothetical protein
MSSWRSAESWKQLEAAGRESRQAEPSVWWLGCRLSDWELGFSSLSRLGLGPLGNLLLNGYRGHTTLGDKEKLNPVALSASELYRLSDYHLLAKLVTTSADRGHRIVSAMDPHSRILGLLDHSCNFFFQVARHLYSRGRVDPVPDPLLLRESGSAGNQSQTSESVARNTHH